MVKKKINKLVDKISYFTPYDEHGELRIVECCKNKASYWCIFLGEPISMVCKIHIKNESYMRGIERIFNYKSKKEIPIEDMGFKMDTPTIHETIEKVKHDNSKIYSTEFICVRSIRGSNSLIKLYQSFMEKDESDFGKDSVSYQIWKFSKKIEEDHISDLCKILINCQRKPQN